MALATHVPLLHFFRLWKVLVYVGYHNQWPGVEVPLSDGCQPCCFCWKTGCGMEISDGLFDAGELIDIEDGVLVMRSRCGKVVADSFCGRYDVSWVPRFHATGRVKDEGIVIYVTDYFP